MTSFDTSVYISKDFTTIRTGSGFFKASYGKVKRQGLPLPTSDAHPLILFWNHDTTPSVKKKKKKDELHTLYSSKGALQMF